MNNIFFTSDIATDYPILGTDTELSWLHEECFHNETLLITIGDSWTWGDHLGNINWTTQYDDPVRLKSVYGKKLAEKLNADWILVAKPGCSNYWMLEKLKLFYYQIKELKPSYKRIIITIVLTEDFREFEYSKELRYTQQYFSMIDQSKDLFDFLQKAEKHLLLQFINLFKSLEVEYYITRAFTDFWPENIKTFENILLDKTWCDVFQTEVGFQNYQQVVPFIGQMSINGITKLINFGNKRNVYLKNFLEIEEKITARYNFFDASWYNIKGSTWHPNPVGHEIFAEYLFEKIQ
jgi:hypothetical protein